MWRTRIKVPRSARRITKGRLVIPNRTVTLNTLIHARLDRTKIAEGPGQGRARARDRGDLEPVHLTRDRTDREATVGPAPIDPTTTTLTADHTEVLLAETEDAPALGPTETVTVPTLRMITGRRGRGRVIPAGLQPIQAYIKILNHFPTQSLRKAANLQILLTCQSLIKEPNPQSLTGLQNDRQIQIPSASASLIWTPVTVNLAPITSQKATNHPLRARALALRCMKDTKKAAPAILTQSREGKRISQTEGRAQRRAPRREAARQIRNR